MIALGAPRPQVFAAPMELYAGRQLTAGEVTLELQRLAYGPVAGRVAGRAYSAATAAQSKWAGVPLFYDGESVSSQILQIQFRDERISALEDDAGTAVAVAQFEPLLIGNIFPTHGEDRLDPDA